jgi:peptide chain release factor 1
MDQIMDGDIDELCSALVAEHQAEQLASMMEK